MMAGADDYLTKPFAADEVLEAVEVRLDKKASVEARHEGVMDELRSTISSALPHELRTPLAAVLGITQVLLVEHQHMAPDMATRMLKDVYRSARRLERTVESFHFFTQLRMLESRPEEAAAYRRRCTPEAGRLVGEAVQWVAHEHRRRGDVRLHVGDGSAAVAAEHLKNATAELVDNAFKFSPSGSPVTVRAGQEGEAFVLEVRDEGCGFRPTDAQRVGAFLQFGRAEREHQGSGLGLGIVRSLADLYGGALEVDTAPDEGTTVRLALPVAAGGGVREAYAAPAA
jgi:signal transduction histidine kinase